MDKEDDFNNISMDIDDFSGKEGAKEPFFNEDIDVYDSNLDSAAAPYAEDPIFDSGADPYEEDGDEADPYAEEPIFDEDKGDHCAIVSGLCFINPEPSYKTIAQSRYSDFLDESLTKKSKNKANKE